MAGASGDGIPDGQSALRALLAASDQIEALRRGGIDPEIARGSILRVANAVDRSLRRLLRDDDAADLSLRLKALAPDELATDAVLAELRRSERLPMDLAASIHELFQTRRRLEAGGLPDDADRTRAVRVADLVAMEIQRPRPRAVTQGPAEEPIPADVPSADPSGPWWGRLSVAGVAGLALLVILLVGGGIWLAGRGTDTGIEEGIALFRSGDYAEAAQYFWRYAQEHPEDSTPHLYLARIHRRMNRPELAADAIRQAQLLAPEDPAVHRELGFLLLDTGRADVAVDRFRRAIELDEESPEGWIGLVRALRDAGRAEEADSTIALAPADVRALLARQDSI